MSESTDLIFVASETLFEQKKQLNNKVIVSHHGVDFDHFNKVDTGKISLPKDIPKKQPIIGFFGLIEEWIDLNLIHYLATHEPTWNFLMIGRVAVKNNPCEHLNNVHFIGRRAFSELPDYAASFSAAILPYKLNQQVINSNPIKLREYLATGKPVISVNFPQVHHYSDVVSIANDYPSFRDAIKSALENDSPLQKRNRIDSVKDATWKARVDNIIHTIQRHLDTKNQINNR